MDHVCDKIAVSHSVQPVVGVKSAEPLNGPELARAKPADSAGLIVKMSFTWTYDLTSACQRATIFAQALGESAG
jgi:hypothetical protein